MIYLREQARSALTHAANMRRAIHEEISRRGVTVSPEVMADMLRPYEKMEQRARRVLEE
jgi:hypothetical protein